MRKFKNALALSFAIGLSLTFSFDRSQAQERENPPVIEMTRSRPMDRVIIKAVATIMDEQHFSGHPLDDDISGRAFDQMIRSLDPLKLYFLKSDIEQFKANRTRLDDFALSGDMDFARVVFKIFLKRVDERIAMAQAHIDAEHDFSLDEKYPIDPEAIDYPEDEAAADDRMRRRIKYSLLVLENERLQAEKDRERGKEQSAAERVMAGDPDEPVTERLHRRYRNIRRRWYQTDADELLELYVSALTTSFDPHTSYMSPDTLENFKIIMSLNLDGIGAQLTSEDGYTKLTSIVPGGAADKDGRLKPGDRIVSVGQGSSGEMVDVIDMKLDDVVQKIRGKAGTLVRLGVLPNGGGEMEVVDIVRAKISLEDSAARSEVVTIDDKVSNKGLKIGYIDLPSFYMDMDAARGNSKGFRSTTRDVSLILSDFRQESVDAVVLDLSRNGGGSLTEAINLTGLFIDRGPVVQVKSMDKRVQQYDDEQSGVAWSGPLIVMTSKESASASEILAGAIQDYRRGIIVGDPTTHGKGTVQTLVDLGQQLFGGQGDMGALKLTIQQFYLPDGKSTQRQGVMSDIILPAITASFDNSEADLDYALPNDQVRRATHSRYKLVDAQILAELRSKSAARIRESSEFDRLLNRIQLFNQQKEEEYVSLNRDEFMKRRAELDAQQEEEEQQLEGQMPKDVVFRKDFYNKEILNITKDYVDIVRKLNLARAG